MATFSCRVQFLDDTDPFNSTSFPEPTRPPLFSFRMEVPLINQLAGVHRLLQAPHKLDDCVLQLSHSGVYLDLELSLSEQRDELEGFLLDDHGKRGKKHSIVLRTQLTVRVHACIEKLYNSNGRDLRRALFSLKQIFQDDEDLVHEFVMAEGLTCLIKVGTEADQNYQNYILRALGQIMLYVDGMNGVIGNMETIHWLYRLVGSKFRLVVKTALKLLLVFVEYSESNAALLIQAVCTTDRLRGAKQWSNVMDILSETEAVDTDLLVYTMTLINKTLAALPDQDQFYDLVDLLEQQHMEAVSLRHRARRSTARDLMEQLHIYEEALRQEDSDGGGPPPPAGLRERRRPSVGGGEKGRGPERRRSHRASNATNHRGDDAQDRRRLAALPPIQEECDDDDDEDDDVTPVTESDSDEGGRGPSLAPPAPEQSLQEEEQEERSSSPLPLGQPSLLASLLVRRRSVVTVPASAEVTRGGSSPAHLPYLPQAPFHLFSYDLEEQQEPTPPRSGGQRSGSSHSCQTTPTSTTRPALGGLLSSSYRQHQESLAAERERRRVEREERLQRIEREERNKHSRGYVDKMEEARFAREERYKDVERRAAQECERDRLPKTRPDLNLTSDPVEAWLPSPPTHGGPDAEQEEEVDDTTEEEEAEEEKHLEEEEREEKHLEMEREEEEAEEEKHLEEEEIEEKHLEMEREEEEAEEEKHLEEEEREEKHLEEEKEEKHLEEEEREEEEREEEEREEHQEERAEDSGLLSDKERQNEEQEEKDSCCASSTSSASSSQEKEPRGGEPGPHSQLLTSKSFMLDMLYCHGNAPGDQEQQEMAGIKEEELPGTGGEGPQVGSVREFAERFGELVKELAPPPPQEPAPSPPPPPPRREGEGLWEQLLSSPLPLRLRDLDFSDLTEEDDRDALEPLRGVAGLLPPPPPPLPHLPPPPPMLGLGQPPPPPPQPPALNKKKKTIRLFWSEVCPPESLARQSLWCRLEPVKLDTSKLEHLFESKSKETPIAKKAVVEGKRNLITVLDSKRSNAINIGLTVLPPPRTIRTAILNFDEYALNKEGLEKIVTMVPTEEEKQRIQEAVQQQPDVPLGPAEQFLLTLSSISELTARLQLWAFKMDYEASEKEVAEPLHDLKEGMKQLENNQTLCYILSALLCIGNFLNGTNARGFDLAYLQKVPEVKDTVHKQSLLHHLCHAVLENFPHSSDLYSEIGAVTRSAKVDFDQLEDNLAQMERRCKASWDHLKVIAKHEMKPQLKQKMSDFLKNCAERIIILKTVHRRITNRFHGFLLFLGQPAFSVRDITVTRFSRVLSEFALEYRTTRERVLQQKQKQADHRERNKTRGKMILDIGAPGDRGPVSSSAPSGEQRQGLGHAEDTVEHEHMTAVLRAEKERPAGPGAGPGASHDAGPGAGPGAGLKTRTRARPGRGGRSVQPQAPPPEEVPAGGEDEADDLMERIVRSAMQGSASRAHERKRSRVNRKSLRRTLRSSLSAEEALALGLPDSPDPTI